MVACDNQGQDMRGARLSRHDLKDGNEIGHETRPLPDEFKRP